METVQSTEFVSFQLSFSTADVENSIFHTAEYAPPVANQPIANVMLLAVNGDLFVLRDEAPQESVPLTEESGLFRIVELDQQP